MLKVPIAEWIRRRLDGWPQQPQDLVMVSWPSDVEGQAVILDYLGRTTTGERNTLLERQAARDFLMDRADGWLTETLQSENPQFDDIPIPLAVWCMMVAVGAVKPPKWGRGRPSMLSALLAKKTLAVVKELRDGPARSQQQAIEWVADATGESTDTIVSKLRTANRKHHTFADGYVANVLEFYGEKNPDLLTWPTRGPSGHTTGTNPRRYAMTQRPQDESPDRSMRRHEVERRCGLSTTTIYRMMQAGTFPRPRRVGARAVRWPESEIERWLSERPRAGDDGEE